MDSNNCTEIANSSVSVEAYLQRLQDRATITMIPALTMLSVFAITGLIGNALILLVYTRKTQLNTTKTLLVTIASFDLVANIGAIPGEINSMLHYWSFDNPNLCKAKVFIIVFTVGGSAMCLVTVAVVRYRKVCAPYGWQITKRQAKIISIVVAFLASLFSVPYTILYGRMSKATPCYKIRGYECYTDDVYKDTIWPLINNGLFVTLYFACIVPLIVLYILISMEAKKHSKVAQMYSKRVNKSVNDICKTPRSPLNRYIIDSPWSSVLTKSASNLELVCRSNEECSNAYIGNKMHCESSEIVNTRSITMDCTDEDVVEKSKPWNQDFIAFSSKNVCPNKAEIPENAQLITRETPNKNSKWYTSDDNKTHILNENIKRAETSGRRDISIPLENCLNGHNHNSNIESEIQSTTNETIYNSNIESDIQSTTNETIYNSNIESEIQSTTNETIYNSNIESEIQSTTNETIYNSNIESEIQSTTNETIYNSNVEPEIQTTTTKETIYNSNVESEIQTTTTKETIYNSNVEPEIQTTMNDINYSSNEELRNKTTTNETIYNSNIESEIHTITNETDCNINVESAIQTATSDKKCYVKHKVKWKTACNVINQVRTRSLGRMTAILIIISAVYVVSYLSFLLLTLYKNLFPHDYANLNMVELSMYHLFLRMYYLNCAINPIIYSLCDSNFRQDCLSLLRHGSRRGL